MSQMKLCATQQRLGKKPETGFEQAGKLCATQSGQVKLCATQQRLGKGSVSQNNQGKSRTQVLNRQESSVSQNQYKQSSVSHMKLCATQSGQVKLCATQQRLEEVPEPCFGSVSQNNQGKSRTQVLNRQESSVSQNQYKQSSVLHMKLCVAQSGQVKLCVTKGPGKRRRLF